jgi:hypothetical protein
MRSTTILSLPIDEASAKVRTGPPLDDGDDLERPVWAGVVPLRLAASAPVDDPALTTGAEPADDVAGFVRRFSGR